MFWLLHPAARVPKLIAFVVLSPLLTAASMALGASMILGTSMALGATSSNISATASDAWLMMVATRCTTPAREAEFNAWYNDIDIPDVLEVPGYQRARRGLRLGTAAAPVSALPASEGRYVALYDIASGNIDKTIIDMLMATRKMESRGRSTNLLAVTERVYYVRLAPTVGREASGAKVGVDTSEPDEYFYVERIDCCADAAAETRFNDWFDREHMAAVLARPGFERATRYELYRVLMNEPREASRYLTVYEFRASSAEEAVRQMEAARAMLHDGAQPRVSIAERDSLVFRKIRDVRR